MDYYTKHQELKKGSLYLGAVHTNEDGSGWVLGMNGCMSFDNHKEKQELLDYVNSMILPLPH